MCVALAIYFEARGEPDAGQIAVAHVVRNRIEDPRYPDNACDGVKQGYYWNGNPIRNMCQFSFYCDGMSDEPRNLTAFQYAYDIADATLDGYQHGLIEGSTHYHADYVFPTWAAHHTKIVKIDSHIFYRWD